MPASDKAFYLTTPIYYVNDAPHIGHAYTTTAGDVLTRWHRQRGERVWYLTGVDEHGTKVQRTAEDERRHPAAVGRPAGRGRVAPGARHHRRRQRRLHPHHRRPPPRRCAAVLGGRCSDAGYVYSAPYEGPYCVGCEEFKLPGDLLDGEGDYLGQKVCPIHGRPVEQLSEDNWFFKLSAFQDALLAHYEAQPRRGAAGAARTTRSSPSSSRASPTSRCRARACRGASRCRGTTSRSSTCGSTRCSTTSPPSGTAPSRSRRRRSSSPRPGRPTCTWSARTSCGSTPSTGRRC